MRIIYLAAGAVLLTAQLAFAKADLMAGYYGNTVVSEGTLGVSRLHFRNDHTFDGSAGNILITISISGTWKIDEKGQLCRTYKKKLPGVPNPLCTPLEAHRPGDTWTVMVGDEPRKYSMEQGSQ